MGVPGFFLWLLRRYKKNNFIFDKSKLNILDDIKLLEKVNNLDYLLIDANCLIHPVCFKTIKDNPNIKNIKKLEIKMFHDVILYIEKIIKFVKPKKGVYLAIDGVAPVAKMKQQRCRRFKSVYDNNLWNNIRKKHNKEIPLFWNNSAISPGTLFMKDLNIRLQHWGKKYSVENNLQIIYSSCNTPGEGEHKLLQFIRNNQKSKDKKKETYITYGLDADLIFLILSTGIENTFLLREAYNFDKKSSSDELQYVSIQIMREAIVESIKKLIDLDEDIFNKLNKSNLIDDFIFMCYLLGNDFLPHLPSLDIYNKGIDYLLEIYVDIFKNQNYKNLINRLSEEKINQEFFNEFIQRLANDEEEILKKNFSSKKKIFRCQSTDPYDIEVHRIDNLQFKINDPIKIGMDNMKDWRCRYYKHYFQADQTNIDNFAKDCVLQFLTGLKWVTNYYFDKCCDWKWKYEHLAPPFLNDINNFKINFSDIKFKKTRPLCQLEQLLCILPPQSAYLLSNNLKKIILSNNSDIKKLYPIKFEIDYLYKKKYWMTQPKIPTMNIELIKKHFSKVKKNFSEIEHELNKKQELFIYN